MFCSAKLRRSLPLAVGALAKTALRKELLRNLFCPYPPVLANKFAPRRIKTKKMSIVRHLLASFVFVGAEGFEAKLARMNIRATPSFK